jgi:hypothetical protein
MNLTSNERPLTYNQFRKSKIFLLYQQCNAPVIHSLNFTVVKKFVSDVDKLTLSVLYLQWTRSILYIQIIVLYVYCRIQLLKPVTVDNKTEILRTSHLSRPVIGMGVYPESSEFPI